MDRMMQELKKIRARRAIRAFLLLCLSSGFTTPSAMAQTGDFVYGADLSFVPWQRANGAVWSGFGHEGQPVQQFRDSGWNVVRLRLWHTPDSTNWKTWHNLDSTLNFAHEVVDAGLEWMLDFHYSDTWADPGKQYVPAAWEGLGLETLTDSLYNYTVDVISRCRREGILPAYVQIGNEINTGLCWPVGQLYGTGDDVQAWSNYATLLKAAKQGVIDGVAPLEPPMILIHNSDGGNAAGSEWWIDRLLGRGVRPDAFGFSFYPWWHGTLDDLRENLNFVAAEYGIPVIVVEASYPWTLSGADDQSNILGSSTQLHEGYPADPAGQANFYKDLAQIVREVPEGMGLGVFLWEPAWISTPNATSGGENLAVYDFSGDALPAILVPQQVSVSDTPRGVLPVSASLGIPYPSPTNSTASVTVNLAAGGHSKLALYTSTGQRVRTIGLPNASGQHRLEIDLKDQASGIYLLRLLTQDGLSVTRRIVLVR